MPATLLECASERTERAFQRKEDDEDGGDGGGRENCYGDARVDARQFSSKYIERDTIRKFHRDVAIAFYTAGIERYLGESRRRSAIWQYQDCRERQVSRLQETVCNRQQVGETATAGGDGRAVELAAEPGFVSSGRHGRGALDAVTIAAAFASGDNTAAKAVAVKAQPGLLEEYLVLECSAAKGDLGNV